MKRLLLFRLPIVFGLLACAALSLPANAATSAGRVVFALGSPRATDSAGAERVLSRGDEVFSGDSLATAARERLQLSMADGAFISVQPNSTYVIENYVYNGKPDGTEEATYHLVKGGIRALTGLIGKSKPGAYKVKTAVATIGIRGTGHNTRICQGDCGTLPDGLYHNTWEGVTYVENNVDSKDVPTGRGVYVKDLNTMIQFLEQAPGVVASIVAAVTKAAATEQEDTEPVFQQGEAQQVTSTVSMLPDFLMTDLNYIDPVDPFASVTGDFGYNDVYGFFSGGQLIGALLTEPMNPTDPVPGVYYAEIRTIDLTAMQSGSDPVATQYLNEILTNLASDSTLASNIAALQANPASVAEFSDDPTLGVGWGRWSNGHVLTVYYDSGSESYSVVTDLTENQSVHFIYGPEPPATLSSTGMVTFNFLGGTQSTSLSGATIGQGGTDGTINFDFASGTGNLDMNINHNDSLYTVTAGLYAYDINFLYGGGNATTSASGSACLSSCSFSLLGSFAGMAPDNNDYPQFMNFQYQVDETDPFIGVASFQFGSLVMPTSTVIPFGGLAVVQPNVDFPGTADVGLGLAGSAFLNGSNQFIGAIFTDSVDLTTSFGTVDLDAVLGGDNTAVVSEVQSLYDGAPNASTAAATVATNPASVAEFSYDATNGIGWGRWTNGDFLALSDSGAPAEVNTLSGNQSVHFIFGSAPPDISGLTTSATYNFIGGTQSTTASGSGIVGNGVTSGQILVNFAFPDADITMTVDHGTTYNVSGILAIDSLDASIFDATLGDVTATSGSSGCNPCNVTIDGGFAGPSATAGVPQFAGLAYEIQDSSDSIMGVAGFEVVP